MFLFKERIAKSKSAFKLSILYFVTPLVCIGLAYLFSISIQIGVTVSAVTLGSILLLFCIAYPKFGFYFLIVFVFFVAFFERLFNADFQVGIVPKVLTGAIIIGILLKKVIHHERILSSANNPITYIYLINILYIGLEAFNPNIDSLKGWTPVFIGSILLFLYYVAGTYVFESRKAIKFFIKFWLILAFITAVYGCIQQWFGLPPWEYKQLLNDPHTYALFYQNGFLRKYSFLADPPSFGILMGSTGVMSLCLSLGNYSNIKRILLVSGGVVMIVSMSYSGTRMATAVIVFGLLFFGLLTIQNRKTILLLSTIAIFTLIILFLPIYGNGVLIRIRSTFHPQEDASMQVRDINRHEIQPYMHRHPIGGGINTSGGRGGEIYPNHPLAGFPPDGAFMQTALEQGWIGFGLLLIIMFSILKYGINKFYRSSDREIKMIYAVLLSVIFCWYMAQYSQTGQTAFNIVYLYMASLAIVARLHTIDDVKTSKSTYTIEEASQI